MATNLKGAWLVAQEAVKRMVAAETHGSIINIASILAFRAAKHLAPYAASKAELLQLTRSLSLEWARHKIRVNATLPLVISSPTWTESSSSEPKVPTSLSEFRSAESGPPRI